jgi:hypothetical protein
MWAPFRVAGKTSHHEGREGTQRIKQVLKAEYRKQDAKIMSKQIETTERTRFVF